MGALRYGKNIYGSKFMLDISDCHQSTSLEAIFHAESIGVIENLLRKRFDQVWGLFWKEIEI